MSAFKKTFYYYKCNVTKIYDGDTITCDIDLGFGIVIQKQKIRLYGINTPEIRGDSRQEGLQSKHKLIEFLENKDIILESIKDKKGKYGRWLGIIYADGINVNDWLIENSLAVKYVV